MNDKEWKEMKKEFYKTDYVVTTDEGSIDFGPENFKKLKKNGNNITYDQYLDIMRASCGSERGSLSTIFYSCGGYAECKGQIQFFTKDKKKVLFKRIYVGGSFLDGQIFDGKEDHVWMDARGFEQFSPGDSISFHAEVYRYLKKDGKRINFGLQNPDGIEKVESYSLPTDDDMLRQGIADFVCSICMLSEQCYGVFCMREEWRNAMSEMLFAMSKAEAEKR